MSRLIFWIPFLYSFSTRMDNSIIGLLNWVSQYLLPLCLIIFLFANFFNLAPFLLVLTLLYMLYEIGYIQNDTETIKTEKNPTLRLNKALLDYYEKNKRYIYIFRIAFSILLSVLATTLFEYTIDAVYLSWAIPVVYFIYNRIRGYLTYIVHFLLLMLRYIIPLLPFIDASLPMIIFIALLYPIPAIIVRISRNKVVKIPRKYMFILNDYSRRYVFIMRYYMVLFLIAILFSYLISDIDYSYSIVFLYFLIRSILFNLKFK